MLHNGPRFNLTVLWNKKVQRKSFSSVTESTLMVMQKKLTRTQNTQKINRTLMKVAVQFTRLCRGPSREGASVPVYVSQ